MLRFTRAMSAPSSVAAPEALANSAAAASKIAGPTMRRLRLCRGGVLGSRSKLMQEI
jgi:hypothetical protein